MPLYFYFSAKYLFLVGGLQLDQLEQGARRASQAAGASSWTRSLLIMKIDKTKKIISFYL